jgi:hypothetical protein
VNLQERRKFAFVISIRLQETDFSLSKITRKDLFVMYTKEKGGTKAVIQELIQMSSRFPPHGWKSFYRQETRPGPNENYSAPIHCL